MLRMLLLMLLLMLLMLWLVMSVHLVLLLRLRLVLRLLHVRMWTWVLIVGDHRQTGGGHDGTVPQLLLPQTHWDPRADLFRCTCGVAGGCVGGREHGHSHFKVMIVGCWLIRRVPAPDHFLTWPTLVTTTSATNTTWLTLVPGHGEDGGDGWLITNGPDGPDGPGGPSQGPAMGGIVVTATVAILLGRNRAKFGPCGTDQLAVPHAAASDAIAVPFPLVALVLPIVTGEPLSLAANVLNHRIMGREGGCV